jgi:hypothetical protein
MNRREEFYFRVCDCGRVHAESRHFRLSFHPAEFIALLRQASGIGSIKGASAARQHQVSAEDREMPGDSEAGMIIRYPLITEQ